MYIKSLKRLWTFTILGNITKTSDHINNLKCRKLVSKQIGVGLGQLYMRLKRKLFHCVVYSVCEFATNC